MAIREHSCGTSRRLRSILKDKDAEIANLKKELDISNNMILAKDRRIKQLLAKARKLAK